MARAIETKLCSMMKAVRRVHEVMFVFAACCAVSNLILSFTSAAHQPTRLRVTCAAAPASARRPSACVRDLPSHAVQVDFDQDVVIGSDAIERMSSMGACGLCALLLWLHCCW